MQKRADSSASLIILVTAAKTYQALYCSCQLGRSDAVMSIDLKNIFILTSNAAQVYSILHGSTVQLASMDSPAALPLRRGHLLPDMDFLLQAIP